VRALSLLNGDLPTTSLVIVGEGDERQRLERLTRELGLEHRVTFAGALPREMVALHLAAADAFLFPTERDEAAPLILPQAMACSRPVVASKIGGITEVIGEFDEYGLLIGPGNVGALVQAMGALVRDDGLRLRLGEAARRRVLAEYTIERMVERTLNVYRIAINRLNQERKR
jgi:glycosyltransferase involved in cell wall biosynthesis